MSEEINRIMATFAQVLRSAYLQPIARAQGKSPLAFTKDQTAEALAPYQGEMASHMVQLRLIGEQLRMQGAQDVHNQLHGQPGVDHEMLDQAVEFSNRPDPDDDGPAIPLETVI